MSVLIFLAVLFVLVLVHEWGHFIVAKKTGMRVDEFGIGFPPKIFGIKKGETEYTFNWLPIGGFVKIWGENGDEQSPLIDSEQKKDYSRSFSHRPKWAQALVLVAGVTMNVLLAWVLFAVTFMIGVPTAVEDSAASDSAKLYATYILPESPASVIPVHSTITSVSNKDSIVINPNSTEFISTVSQSGSETVTVVYEANDTEETVSIVPVQGLIESDPDRYAIGVSVSLVETISQPFFAAISNGLSATWAGLVGITTGLWSLIAQSFTGQADFSQVAGPVGIVGMVGDAAAVGITALLTFTAIISLNLAVINLLPFPALDGGRLVFVAIEAVTRRTIPSVWAGRVNLIGFALLMILMVAVTYNDIIRIL